MKKGGFHMDTPVHDPAIFVDQDGTYYIFGTHMCAATSKDLRNWEQFARDTGPQNKLFQGLFGPKSGAFDYVGKFNGKEYAVWAPDVSYNPYLKKYVMYFCTTASFMKSCLCMATADEIKGPYIYQCTLLYSGFDRKTCGQTNLADVLGADMDISGYLNPEGVYNHLRWPNCIDPNTFHDRDGRFWMVYGSWSGGIFLLELDEHTGLPIHPKGDKGNQVDPYFGYRLMGGGHRSIEGPFIFYDEVTDYYYLTASFGWLERDGGYQIRLFRAKEPMGPYVDMAGNTCFDAEDHENYGLKLMGNYNFPSLDMAYKAPGHNSVLLDRDGKLYLVYHQRFDMQWEIHEPRVHQLFRTEDGWLTVCPFATEGETRQGKRYSMEEIQGEYYVVDHGRDISKIVHDAVKMMLPSEGKEITLGDDASVTLKLDSGTYHGVVTEMNDEAGNPTLCMSLVGQDHSIWAVKYC